MFGKHRRFVLLISVCVFAAIVASCGGSQVVSNPDGARQAAGYGSVVRREAAPAAFNGTWGVEYGEGVEAGNNAGENTTGACSGTSKRMYGCGEFVESVTKLMMPDLSVSAPPTEAPSSSSSGGYVHLGDMKVNLANSAGFVGPDFVADAGAYQSSLYWVDQIIPPTPDANHPQGTPITYTASIGVHYADAIDDCWDANSFFQTSVSGDGLGKDLFYSAGCSTTGKNVTSTTMTSSYGGSPLTIDDTFEAFIYAGTDADHTEASAAFSNIHIQFHLNEKTGATYTTASGVCYKTTGTCP
jgi:hypothetical protein